MRPTRKILSKSQSGLVATAKPAKASISEPITVKDLSAALAVKVTDIIPGLMSQGIMANANQVISSEAAEIVALELGVELTVERKAKLEDELKLEFEQRERKNLKTRSVVATMLGHVDHGKTSLLDKIRSTQVTASEAGGITQHIGAYQIKRKSGKVTFLDTPGHEAFTAMRSRGANMTDVVVLVIAADDGVMPQTAEAIAHGKAAGVPIIVALNKIDLPGCDLNRIYSQLAEHELAPIEWGGTTDVVKTSAISGEGIEDLLEHLEYTADLLELKADDSIPAAGWVVEAKMSSQKGPVATLLIKEGCMKKGDVVLAGSAYGRVKTLRNSFGRTIKSAESSTPVEITGLNDVPEAGDRFYCLDDINRAKNIAEENQMQARDSSLAERTSVTLDNLFNQIEAGNIKELNLVIRADVQGSVDVLKEYLNDLSTEEVKIKILHAAPGGITEGDVVLAEASNAIIIGFNVVADDRVAKIAEDKKVDIRLYNIIYRITEDLKKSMVGLLDPEEQEKTLGRAIVRQTFKVSKVGTIAGCYVNSGVVTNNAKVRLIRDNVVMRNDLSLESLKHFKDDAREVKAGLECGIKLIKFDDIKIDDVLEMYEIIKVERTL
jgi:translation initiation factor IF-2